MKYRIIEETGFDGSSRYIIEQHVKKWSWTKFKYEFVWEHAKTWGEDGYGYYYFHHPTVAQTRIDELIKELKKSQFKPVRTVYTK